MAFDQIWDHELPMFASLFEEELKSVVAHARRYGVGTAASSRRQRHLRDRLQNQLNYGRSPESFSHHRDADGDNSSLYSGATERSEIIRQQRDEAADKQEKKQLREIRMDRFLNSIPQPGNEMVENEQTQKVDFGKKSIIPPPIHVFKNSYKLTTQKNRLLKKEKFVNRKISNLKHALEKAEHTKRFVESQKIHTCKLIDKVEDVKDDLILPPPLPLPPKRAVWKIIPKGSAKELEPIETFEDFLQKYEQEKRAKIRKIDHNINYTLAASLQSRYGHPRDPANSKSKPAFPASSLHSSKLATTISKISSGTNEPIANGGSGVRKVKGGMAGRPPRTPS